MLFVIFLNDVLSYLNKHNITIDKTKLDENNFSDLVKLLDTGEISSKMGKEILNDLIIYGGNVSEIVDKKGLKQISDTDSIKELINKVINDNMSVVEDYKKGNERSLKYLIGQVMKESKGQANPKVLNDILLEELSNK